MWKEENTRDPLISVIMPAKDSASYIRQAIRSVQRQTYRHWELLVIDDGSGDRTRAIVAEMARGDARIRLLERQRFSSPGLSRRYGIDHASGGWIAFLDSDDLWREDKLDVQLRRAQQSGSRFLFTASAFLVGSGTPCGYVMRVPERVAYPRILRGDMISCSSVLIRRELLDGCFQEPDTSVSEDYAAWIRILRDREAYAEGINQPLLIYRLSGKSISHNKLHSALRTFRTYRHMGLSPFRLCASFAAYALRGLSKYLHIFLSIKRSGGKSAGTSCNNRR